MSSTFQTLWSWDGLLSAIFVTVISQIILQIINRYVSSFRPSMRWVDRVIVAHIILLPIAAALTVVLTNGNERIITFSNDFAHIPHFPFYCGISIITYNIFFDRTTSVGKLVPAKIIFSMLSLTMPLSAVLFCVFYANLSWRDSPEIYSVSIMIVLFVSGLAILLYALCEKLWKILKPQFRLWGK